MEIGLAGWAFVFFSISLFSFVVYLAATNQIEDFIRLVGVLCLSVAGLFAIVGLVLLRVIFSRLGIFIMAFTLCCFIVKWIFF